MVPIYFSWGACVDGLMPRGRPWSAFLLRRWAGAAVEMHRTCQPAAAAFPQLWAQNGSACSEEGRTGRAPASQQPSACSVLRTMVALQKLWLDRSLPSHDCSLFGRRLSTPLPIVCCSRTATPEKSDMRC